MDELLSHTQDLLNQVFWFQQKFDLKPKKEHIGSSIEWTDIKERKDDFLKELINTITSWVYSKTKSEKIVNNRLERVNGDKANAYSFLTTQAFSKFRPGHPQGQFGELLLFNFIQHFFKAAPLLRKQNITTSTGHERYGADAIHYKNSESKNMIFLGEAKCYKSKYNFNSAFKQSLKSITDTFDNFSKELALYTYDDFIEPELEKVAKKFKSNELENTYFELVCLVAYNETNNRDGNSEKEIKESIQNIIEDRCKNLQCDYYDKIEERLLERINYIIFPIWKFDKLLEKFENKVGSK